MKNKREKKYFKIVERTIREKNNDLKRCKINMW